jgi:Zn-dependent peptidase ImmA (M78 family)
MIELIEKHVNRFREQNSISSSEAVNIKSLLIKLGVNVVFDSLSENFSGMAIKIGENRFMLINASQSLGRQNFTIAHELYHLYIQQNFNSMSCQTGLFNKKNSIEYEADSFSACFLMPESGILDLIPDSELKLKNPELYTIVKLEQYFGVSRKAILRRLNDIGILKRAQYDQYSQLGAKSTAVQFGFDTSLYMPGNEKLIIGDYGQKARLLFEKGKISESHYLSLIHSIGADLITDENGKEN